MKCVKREVFWTEVGSSRFVYADFGLQVHSAVYIGIWMFAFWRSFLPPSSWYFSLESGSKTFGTYVNTRRHIPKD